MQHTSFQLVARIALFLFALAQAAHPGSSTTAVASEIPVDNGGGSILDSAAKDLPHLIHEQRARGLLDAAKTVKRVAVSTVDELLVRLPSQCGWSEQGCMPPTLDLPDSSGTQDLTV
jgi:hypothetical protein